MAIRQGCTSFAGGRQWPRAQRKITDEINAIGSRGCRLPHTRQVGECRGTWSANWTFSRTSPRAEHGRQTTIRRCRVCFPAIRLGDGHTRAHTIKRIHAWGSRPTVAGASGKQHGDPLGPAGTRRLFVGNVARAALCTYVRCQCTLRAIRTERWVLPVQAFEPIPLHKPSAHSTSFEKNSFKIDLNTRTAKVFGTRNQGRRKEGKQREHVTPGP